MLSVVIVVVACVINKNAGFVLCHGVSNHSIFVIATYFESNEDHLNCLSAFLLNMFLLNIIAVGTIVLCFLFCIIGSL